MLGGWNLAALAMEVRLGWALIGWVRAGHGLGAGEKRLPAGLPSATLPAWIRFLASSRSISSASMPLLYLTDYASNHPSATVS